jgi:hypothetical protein
MDDGYHIVQRKDRCRLNLGVNHIDESRFSKNRCTLWSMYGAARRPVMQCDLLASVKLGQNRGFSLIDCRLAACHVFARPTQSHHSWLRSYSRGTCSSRMSPPDAPNDEPSAGNGAPAAIGGAATMSAPPHPHPHTEAQSTTPTAWSSQMSTFPANNGAAGGPNFAQYSASTAAILERIQGKNGHAAGSAAFEAKRAEILQSYVTSDKLPTPPPAASTGRRGRGGRVSTPSGLKTEVGASPSGPSSGRASGRGRGRGRGRGGRGGRGGKRKRSESDEESDVSQCGVLWNRVLT